MCGLSGFFTLDASTGDRLVDQNIINRMNDRLSHRGPDGWGSFVQARGQRRLVLNGRTRVDDACPASRGTVAFGHRRLSIIDHSEQGFQPFLNDDHSIALICNGEVYNFESLRAELIQQGARFSSQSDSEVVLKLYEKEGLPGFNRLRGMYAIALWDANKNQLILHRDRFGEKPLFYTLFQGTLFFASEIKAFRDIPGFRFDVSPEGAASYLMYGHVVPSLGWFNGVQRLSCGHTLIYDGKEIKEDLGWSPEFPERRERSLNACLDEFMDVFKRVISESTIADDIECAVPLSGGIDSSLLALTMNRAGRKFNKFTIYEPRTDKLKDEFERAKLIHSMTAGKHVVLGLDESREALESGLSLVDEPIFSVVDIGLRQTLYSQVAKHTKVAIIGGSADHVFLNGGRFHYAMKSDEQIRKYRWLESVLPASLLGRWGRYADGGFHSFQPASYASHRNHSFGASVRDLVPAELEKAVSDEFSGLLNRIHPTNRTHAMLYMSLAMDRQYIQYLDDLVGMRYGLEVRDPFFHYDLTQFISTVPLRYLWPDMQKKSYDHRAPVTKYLVRLALDRISNGKAGHVVQGKKVNWGGDKKKLITAAVEQSGPGGQMDVKDNAFLLEACHLPADKIISIFSEPEKFNHWTVEKMAALNLWIHAHPEYCEGKTLAASGH